MSGSQRKAGNRRYRPDDFLSCGVGSGCHRLGSEGESPHKGRVFDCVRKLRSRRLAWFGWILGILAGIVPEGFFRWAFHGVDGGSIWDDEMARSGGPSDTGIIRIERCEDEQIGMRIIAAVTPILIAAAVIAVSYTLLNSYERENAMRSRNNVEISPAPPDERHSSALALTTGRLVNREMIGPRCLP